MSNSLIKIGDKVKQVRKSHGYSQEKLASMVGVSLVSVSRIERNEQPPSLAFMAEFAKVCDVSVDSLLELVRKDDPADTDNTATSSARVTTSHSEFVNMVYQLADTKNEKEKFQLTKSCIASYMKLLDENNRIAVTLSKLQKLAGKLKTS